MKLTDRVIMDALMNGKSIHRIGWEDCFVYNASGTLLLYENRWGDSVGTLCEFADITADDWGVME